MSVFNVDASILAKYIPKNVNPEVITSLKDLDDADSDAVSSMYVDQTYVAKTAQERGDMTSYKKAKAVLDEIESLWGNNTLAKMKK